MGEFLANLGMGAEIYFFEQLPFYWSISPTWMKLSLVGLLAGILGSFLNMAVWRIPRGESIFLPRSHCPVCKHVLSPKDLFPILSYLFLRGRCRYCDTQFGTRYVLIEIFLVLSAILLFSLYGLTWGSLGIMCSLAFVIFCYGVLRHQEMDKSIIDQQTGQILVSNLNEKNMGSMEYSETSCGKKGFTYIEVLMTLIIVAAVIIPFGNIFLSSYGRVIKNKEYIMAFNLMEEKMEELRMVPFSKLKSDWNIYAKPAENRDGIYSGNHTGHFFKMRTDRSYFETNFSDILTTEKDLPRLAMARFQKAYKQYYGIPYEFYPEDYKIFRRVVRLEPVETKLDKKFARKQGLENSKKQPQTTGKSRDFLKITVQVFIDSKSNSRKLEISRYRRK